MAKLKTAFFCQNCGTQHTQWYGQCPSCKAWNSIVEEVISTGNDAPLWAKQSKTASSQNKPLNILEIELTKDPRIVTGNTELDRVLGGGIVPGSLILLGGEPGIGKSTLMLQLALQLDSFKTLYVSGEESGRQIKMRAERIGITNKDCYVLTETRLEHIFDTIKEINPQLVIVDSIQTLQTTSVDSSPGSVSQIRESAAELLRFAKESGTPVILIGHITKDGVLAGPKILEHMVDCVLQFEGDRNFIFRIVRAHKNRFGSTAEIGIYQMLGQGLRPVENPSEVLITNHSTSLSGSAVSVTLEGVRPMLIEVQALVSSAVYGTPQRTSTGYDTKRLNMLLAVLEKRAGFRLSQKDVFLNITGGIRIEDPAIDLAVVAAVLSSNEDVPIANKVCFAAEVGLSGEIRPVNRVEQRISEATKLGYEIIFISEYNKINPRDYKGIRVMPVSRIEQLVKFCFS